MAVAVSASTGGLSKSNATLGTGGDKNPEIILTPITTSDRAGAGIITALVLVGMAGGTWYVPSSLAYFLCSRRTDFVRRWLIA